MRSFVTSVSLMLLMTCCSGDKKNDVAGNRQDGVKTSVAAPPVVPASEGPVINRPGFVAREDDLAGAWSYAMTCLPEDARRDDILRLQFHRVHGGETEILTPSGNWFIYAFPDDTSASVHPPMDSDVIAHADAMGINLRTARGQKIKTAHGIIDDNLAPEPIFTEPGVYSIMVSSNMEVDKEDLVLDTYCHFNFHSR